MSLVKNRMSSVRARGYAEDLSSPFGVDDYPKVAMEEGHINSFDKLDNDSLFIKNLATRQPSSPPGSQNSANSNEFVFQAAALHAKEHHHPLINFEATGTTSGCGGAYHDSSFIQADNGSLLSFKQKEDYSGWEAGSMSYSDNGPSPMFQDNSGNWLYTEAIIVADSIQEPAFHEANLQKRPYMGESMEAAKKQCNNPSTSKKPKPKTESPSKDPQSIAAKQRRERISERLKTLQDLVPNGSKVDLVTMLEKAINYVKFLQLQVKVLATDELWPAQGGKAPDISQVKEAIDAILSSRRDRNSRSSSK